LSNINQDAGPGNPYYRHKTFNMLQFAGQTVRIYFGSTNDASTVTNFRLDDVSLLVTTGETISTPGSVTGQPTPAQGDTYSFSVPGASSSLGHTVEYSFDWGDGTSSSWSTSTTASHAWTSTGQKNIIVTARCQTHTTISNNNSPGNSVNVQAAPVIRISPTSLAFDSGASRPQIYVELDWMEDNTHSHKPSQAVIDRVVRTFASEGIDIHIDVNQAIPHQDVLAIVSTPSTSPSVQAIRDQYFNHINDSRYYYAIWCHNISGAGIPPGSSGIADLGGRIHLVSLGSGPGQVGTENQQVGTFVHELGHNLGQRHGGADDDNYKPNYVSVMNYMFQMGGVGDTLVALGLAKSSAGINNFGYSHGILPPLDENNLDETVGIGLGRPVDWNCNGISTDKNVAKDLQDTSWCIATGSRSTIADFDNWSGIVGNIRSGITPMAKVLLPPAEPCIGFEEYELLQTGIARMQKMKAIPAGGKGESKDGGSGAGPNALTSLGIASTFFIYNDGATDLTVSSISLDQSAAWISWWPSAPFTIAPGQSRGVTVYIDYNQAPGGQTTRRLLVNSNDTDESPYPNAVLIQTSIAPRGALQFKASSYQVAESGGSIRASVGRTGGSFGPASVSFATANGTAQAGADYTSSSGTLKWSDGDTSDKFIDVPIIDDSISEGEEYFTINLSGATGSSLGMPITATATILDHMLPRGTLQFTSPNYTVNENGGAVRIFVSRNGGAFGAASASYATTDGTAVAGQDYTAQSGSLNWADGDSGSKYFDIPIIDDGAYEPGEAFTINLSNVTGASAGPTALATVNIIDDDNPNVQLTGLTLSDGAVYFTVSGPPGIACVVQVSSDLVNWSSLLTNTIPSSGSFVVNDSADHQCRFYRIMLQ
jgi:hypothetical protein